MNFLKHHRSAAWIALVGIIAVSIFGGVNRSIAQLGSRVEKAYISGTAKGGSVQEDLSKMANYAQNLYAISSAIEGEDPSFRAAIDTLRNSLDSPEMEKDTVTSLFSAAALAYNRILNNSAVSESQRNSAISYFYEIESTRQRLANNEEYRNIADRYNRAIASFPASVLVWGKKPVISFAG